MKTCFKCGQTKQLIEFYPHPRMADGHLNKCKACNKKDSRDRIEKMKQDPKWIMAERERCRQKIAKARANGLKEQRSYDATQRWRKNNREKSRAHLTARRAQRKGELKAPPACQRCHQSGLRLVMHHPDYTQPKFVHWLCEPCHGFVHRKPEPISP